MLNILLLAVLTMTTASARAADPPAAVETDPRLHADGKGWRLDRARITDASRPRVLLMGDSILSGYHKEVLRALDGKAFVDVWIHPYCQSEHFNRVTADVLGNGPYDVIHFNMGLHGWPEGRIKPGTFEPLTRSFVEVLRAKSPRARLIWANTTPVLLEGKPSRLDPEINGTIIEHNRMASNVMREMQVPESDFYGLLVGRLDLARGDRFHWTAPASKLLADTVVETVLAALAAPPAAVHGGPLTSHIATAADLGERRDATAAWTDADGRLTLTATRRTGHAWIDLPAPPAGWNLGTAATVEATITNTSNRPVTVQWWTVATHGWESIGDVATLAPAARRTFSCRLRETFPDGTPKLDPRRVGGLRVMLRDCDLGTAVEVSGIVATGTAAAFALPSGRIEPPPVTDGPPAAGRRVRLRLAGNDSAEPPLLLHLPEDWRPEDAARYPVIIEYPGNIFFTAGCYSTGRPEQCVIGYGMSRGRGAIWASLPFVARGQAEAVENGWGGPDVTADFSVRAVERICDSFGGDRDRVVLTGFSRGAIACGFIGLRNDRIASLWRAFHLCQHYDGDGWGGATAETALERARRFRGTAVFQTDNPEDKLAPFTTAMRVPTEFAASGLGAHACSMFLDDRGSTRRLRRWFEQVVGTTATEKMP